VRCRAVPCDDTLLELQQVAGGEPEPFIQAGNRFRRRAVGAGEADSLGAAQQLFGQLLDDLGGRTVGEPVTDLSDHVASAEDAGLGGQPVRTEQFVQQPPSGELLDSRCRDLRWGEVPGNGLGNVSGNVSGKGFGKVPGKGSRARGWARLPGSLSHCARPSEPRTSRSC
jgi:hypothetical protein